MSAAIGDEPSLQTSIKVVANSVRNKPAIVGPNQSAKDASGTKARIRAVSTKPKRIHRRTMREPDTPSRISFK